MPTDLTPEILTQNPSIATTTLHLPNGQRALLRLQRPADRWILGRYFLSLKPATRNIYAPHPFDMATAHQLCAATDYSQILRFIAVADVGGEVRIIAYFLLKLGVLDSDRRHYDALDMPLRDAEDAALAPSVADAYQSRGIGSLILPHIFDLVRRLGRQRVVLWGGTRELNHRAVHFYEKFGFVKVGEFEITRGDTVINNYNMILNL